MSTVPNQTQISNLGEYDAALKCGKPVMVYFHAPWSGPCKQMEPVLINVSGLFGDRISFLRVNIDDVADVTQREGVRSVPMFMIYSQGGDRTFQLIGTQTQSSLAAKLDSMLF